MAAPFTEARISESGPYGVMVQLWPLQYVPPFGYGSPKDRLFPLEYPAGYKHSYDEPYHCTVVPGKGAVCDDPRVLIDCEVRRSAFSKALEYAKTLGVPLKMWDSDRFVWFDEVA